MGFILFCFLGDYSVAQAVFINKGDKKKRNTNESEKGSTEGEATVSILWPG